MPTLPVFDPEVGVPDADMAAVERVCAAFEAAQEDYPLYEQVFNTTTGVWEPLRCSYVQGSYFLGVNEDGDGLFEDRDGDRGHIPADFITTPRAQWVAAWEASKQARVDEHAAQQREAADVQAAVHEQQLRATHLKEVTLDRAAQRAILDPSFITDRGDGESLEAWQARAVRAALAAPVADLTWALGSTVDNKGIETADDEEDKTPASA